MEERPWGRGGTGTAEERPCGCSRGGGEAVREQDRRPARRRRRAGSPASAASGGVAGRAWRMREQGTPDPWRLLLVGYWESGRP